MRIGFSIAGLYRRLAEDPLLRGSLFLMTATAAGSGLGFIFWIVAARTSDVAQVGVAAAALSTISLIALLVASGIGPSLLLAIPQGGRRWARTALEGAVGVGVGAFFVSMVGLSLWGLVVKTFAPLDLLGISIISLGAAVAAIFVALDAACIATRNASLVVLRAVLLAFTKLCLLFLPWPAMGGLSEGASAIVLSTIIAGVISSAAVIILLWRRRRAIASALAGSEEREGRLPEGAKLRPWRSLHWDHLAALAGQGPALIVPLIVASILGVEQTGFFYIAWNIAAAFFIVSPAICQSLLAEGARARTEAMAQVRRAARITIILLTPLLILVALAAEPLLGLFGPAYATGAYLILLCFVAAAIPDAITNIAVAGFRLARRRAAAALINIVTFFIIVLGALLLARYGLVWVGASWIIAQLGGVAVALLLLRYSWGQKGRGVSVR